MNKLLLCIAILDGIGMGIVFPTLPPLLESLLRGSGDVARHYGFLLAVYAVAMFFFSPVLGLLSDWFGRRPFLLFSLLGTAFDNMIMALAPNLAILYIGRMLAGITGANLTIVNAYLADTTTPETRTAAFGRLNACFGIGFIAGPLLGGLTGTYSLRAPFYLGAALNAVSFLICLFALPESRPRTAARSARPRLTLAQLNPFASLHAVITIPGVKRLLYLFCTIDMVGQIPAVLWIIYGMQTFHWSSMTVGVSLALFGLLHALCQAVLPAIAQKHVGQKGTILAGMIADTCGFTIFSIARTTPAAFSAIPFLCLGGVALPALQSILSSSTSEERQGEMQGVLTSLNSLVAIIGPLVASNLYGVLRQCLPGFPGSIWLFTTLLYIPCFFLLARRKIGVKKSSAIVE